MERQEGRPGNGNGAHHAPFGERVEHIGSTAQQLWSEAREAVTDLGQTLDLRGRMERHPYATLAAAAGIGYVLGGGLFTSLTSSIVRMGLRFAALPLVKEELMSMAEAALTGRRESKTDD